MILEKKHINRKKPKVSDDLTNVALDIKYNDDDWARFEPTVGEKILAEEIIPVPDRAITFNRDSHLRTKEEVYKQKTDEFKDKFGNTAQYLKFINAHLAEKKNHLDKILSDGDKFNAEINFLNPEDTTKEQLNKKNYKQVKANDVKKVLKYVEEERDAIKEKIEHFSSQIDKAKEELSKKDKEVNEIQTEIKLVEKINDSAQSKIEKDSDTIQILENKLNSFGSKNETEKIFGAINSLVVLLNSKNQATLNELNSVKNEFKKMKDEYDKVMYNLEKKKGKNN